MILLTGKEPAAYYKEITKQYLETNELTGYYVSIIFVGTDQGSRTYVRMKQKYGQELGLQVRVFGQDDHPLTNTNEILTRIDACNTDPRCLGILVQLPLPSRCKADQAVILSRVAPYKDIDGLGGVVFGLATVGCFEFYPATVAAVLRLLGWYQTTGTLPHTGDQTDTFSSEKEPVIRHFLPSLQGTSIAVIGQSNLVGKPLTIACMNLGATVFCANGRSDPELIKQATRKSDIIVSCTGVVHLLDETYVRHDQSQILIDVGRGKKLVDATHVVAGDIYFDVVKDFVAAITPVPGGVGPMTIASLFYNVTILHQQQRIGK